MTAPLSRRLAAGLIFGAFTILLGIATHLMAELAGLGWRLDRSLAFSGRHLYLGVTGASCVVAALVALFSPSPGNRRQRVRSLIAALPFKGEGTGFAALAFLVQFAFFVVSQVGEGCPLRSGDVIAAVVAAAFTAIAGALLVAFGKRRMLEFVLALVWALECGATPQLESGCATNRGPAVRAVRCTPFSFRYRPPPQAA